MPRTHRIMTYKDTSGQICTLAKFALMEASFQASGSGRSFAQADLTVFVDGVPYARSQVRNRSKGVDCSLSPRDELRLASRQTISEFTDARPSKTPMFPFQSQDWSLEKIRELFSNKCGRGLKIWRGRGVYFFEGSVCGFGGFSRETRKTGAGLRKEDTMLKTAGLGTQKAGIP